ncbi:MAG TPA: hypothetical protein VEU11_01225 [Terriglobales bacterium]|nr:hypothetical protein [Terriglobales bacterium]
MAIITFIGILDIGSVVFLIQGLTERARAGARYGVVNTPFSAGNIRNVVVYGNSGGTGNPLLNLKTSVVTVTNPSFGDNVSAVQVVISGYQYHFFTPLISGDKTLPNIEVSLTQEGP